MNAKVIAYALYLTTTVPLTIFVARTLFKHGGVFLKDVFQGKDDLAAAVNQLLVVGFYLFNLGYVALLLQTDAPVEKAEDVFEVLTMRVGIVALILGAVHLANVWVLNKIRRRAALEQQTIPPVAADGWTVPAPAPFGAPQ